VGLTFRKSIRLPGGFRVNLSKSGVGASWGVPGLRVGTGPGGPRLSASLPGTGVGYTTSLSGLVDAVTGRTRAARQTAEDLAGRDAARMEERERAEHEVALFENRVALLTSLHKEPPRVLDWRAIAAAKAPADPAARAAWQWWTHLAGGVLAGDAGAYAAAIQHLAPFRELAELGGVVEAQGAGPVVMARILVHGQQVVPAEVPSVTKAGKPSAKKMPAKRFWEIYQDHVCSAVIRVGRELLALLPAELALVHARATMLDTATGREEARTICSAGLPREAMAGIDFDRIDPSDAIERFPHAMELSTRTGFAPVEEIEVADLVAASGATDGPQGGA
jgi:hypothetical protein